MNSASNHWQEITRAALLGTERLNAPLSPAGPVGELTTKLPAADKEAAFLGMAAALRLYLRAGERPAKCPAPAPDPAEPDDRPVIGPETSSLGVEILSNRADLLPEWLEAVAASGRVVGAATIVRLMEHATRDGDRRESVSAVVGALGRWLAAQNPEWSWAAAAGAGAGAGDVGDLSAWETGAKAARKLLFARVRKADPAKAREMVAAAFAQEAADERAAFVGALGTGLSPADEPFLEQCLDDRAPSVRDAARDLLMRLPQSALSQRMLARVKDRVTIAVRGKKERLELVPPDDCDKAMIRDGLEPLNPKETDKKAIDARRDRWVAEMVAYVPPSHWCGVLGKSPTEILAVLRKHDQEDNLIRSLAAAAVNHRDTAWAEALADKHGQLILVLPATRREELALAELGKSEPEFDGPIQGILDSLPKPWTDRLGRAFLSAVRAYPLRKAARSYAFAGHLHRAGRCLAPEMAADAGSVQPVSAENWETHWRPMFDQLADTLRFRGRMLAAIRAGR